MEKISQELVGIITHEIRFVEALIRSHSIIKNEFHKTSRELIEAALSDLKSQVRTGEIPD